MKRIVYFTVILFISTLLLFSELIKKPEYEFKHLSIVDGLSQNTVMAVYQDKYGYLWFGTQDGLNRYDGKEFRIYKHSHKDPNSIISSNIRVIMETSYGEFWIGTNNGGLSRFKRETDGFENFIHDSQNTNSISGKNIFAILEDSKRNLWIGDWGGGLNRFDREKNVFIKYKHDPEKSWSISSNMVRTIYEDSEGTLWVGNNTGGLNKFNANSGKFEKYCYSESGDMNDDSVMSIFEYQPGMLLIATDGDGVEIFETGKNKFNKKIKKNLHWYLKNGRIRSFYKDKHDVLWISTYGEGIITISKNSKNVFSAKNYKNNIYIKSSLSENNVLNIFETKDELLFFGTSGGGVNLIDLKQTVFKNYRINPLKENNINAKNIRSVLQDKNGSLLIGTDGNGLNILSNSGNKIFPIGNNRIYSLLNDSYETLWVGTYGSGLFKLKNDNGGIINYKNIVGDNNSISDNMVRVIYEDSDKDLWIGTRNGGLNKFNRLKQTFTHYRYDKNIETCLNHDMVTSISEDKDGYLWIGTWNGLNRFNKKEDNFTSYIRESNNKNSLSHDQILSLLIDRDGILWIGTWGGGLNKFDTIKGKWDSYTEADGFPNNVIYGILEEKTEGPAPVLWMSSNKGIIRFETKNNKINVYDASSGVQSDEFNAGSVFQNKKGDMYFGGISGLTEFNPLNINKNNYAPKVLITGVKVFDKYKSFSSPVEEKKEITLNYNENYFTIEFILLNYRSSERNTYEYKLDGFDKNWIKSGKRNNAAYTHLEGGNYTFFVKGANNDGIWSEETTFLKIKIIPPFWSTSWFRTFAILLLLLIFLFFYKLRTRKLKRDKALLEKTNLRLNIEISERKKAEEEKESLQKKLIQSEKMEVLGVLAGGVAHDLNNILGAMVSYPDLLLMKLPENSPLKGALLTIKESGKRAAAVVNDLLTLARRGVKNSKVINLNNVVRQLFELPELENMKKDYPDIKINIDLDENLYNISGSEVQITKSLLNLILNSVEAIDIEGQIFISTKNIMIKEEFRVDNLVLYAGKYAVFRILDNGKGVPEEDIKKIFEPFYTKKNMGRSGTGLGMTVVSGMVVDHKGEIDIWSDVNVGTSIDIYMPATEKKIEKVEDKIKHKRYFGNREKILVIDDVLLQRDIAMTILEQLNYSVKSLSSGEAGIDYLRKNKVDLVLLDMIMDPGIDGLTTYKEIIKSNKDQKVIIVSGFSKPENIEELIKLGINDYIGKPYTIDVLGRSVKKVLEYK